MSINLNNITKTFGAFTALSEVNLEVNTGELVALLGPSGSGKTTLLRIIAGLESPNEGEVFIDGVQAASLDVRSRGVGFVFQHYALFRHMSVFENIAFGLRVRPRKSRPTNSQIKEKVNELLRLVQLEGLGHRSPSQLSGGQRQRVALARALAVEPKFLLLDEPFGALDAKVRQELRQWLRRLHDELHMTSVFVTHDQEEALEVSDRVVVMNKGRIEQVGSPEEVYENPANPFVFNFLGNVNLFRGRIQDGLAHVGEASVPAPSHAAAHNGSALVYVRPHELDVLREPDGPDAIAAVIRYVHAVGSTVRIDLERIDNKETVAAELTRDRYAELKPKAGEYVYIAPRAMRVFVQDADYSI
jgi:sulfate transport system ATP-binding protein